MGDDSIPTGSHVIKPRTLETEPWAVENNERGATLIAVSAVVPRIRVWNRSTDRGARSSPRMRTTTPSATYTAE